MHFVLNVLSLGTIESLSMVGVFLRSLPGMTFQRNVFVDEIGKALLSVREIKTISARQRLPVIQGPFDL